MLEASVITLTYNRPAGLRRCLRSLSSQTLADDRFEVVLVDVSDEPVTPVLGEFEGSIQLRHIRAENRGVAANRNVGASEATAPLVVFLDDDCIAESAWLEKMIAGARANPGALVGGGVRNLDSENAVSTAGQVITEAVDSFSNSGEEGPTFFPGMNFAVPREDYLALGGCDESFGRMAAEDREFMDRWRMSGRTLAAVPDACVVHAHRQDLAGFARQYFNYGRGAWVYHRHTMPTGSGTMAGIARTHLELLGHLGTPLSGLAPVMKLKVVGLLIVWEISNLAGFAWQALRSAGQNIQEPENT